MRGEIKITKFKEFMASDTNKRLCTSRGDLRTPIYGETMYQQGRLTYSDLWRDYVPAGETYALRSMERLCTNRGDLGTPIYGETMYQQGRLTYSNLWRDYVPAWETYTLRSMKRLCTSRGDLHTPIYGETMYQQGRLTQSMERPCTSRGDLRTPIYFAPVSCVEAVVGSESLKQALQTAHKTPGNCLGPEITSRGPCSMSPSLSRHTT